MKLEGESWAHYLAGAVGRYAESAKAEIERLRAEVAEWRRAADHNARIVADQRDQIVKLGAELERMRAALREIRALHQPEWASEQAKAAGKEPWVCALCGTADGLWPCSTVATIREVLGDE